MYLIKVCRSSTKRRKRERRKHSIKAIRQKLFRVFSVFLVHWMHICSSYSNSSRLVTVRSRLLSFHSHLIQITRTVNNLNRFFIENWRRVTEREMHKNLIYFFSYPRLRVCTVHTAQYKCGFPSPHGQHQRQHPSPSNGVQYTIHPFIIIVIIGQSTTSNDSGLTHTEALVQ